MMRIGVGLAFAFVLVMSAPVQGPFSLVAHADGNEDTGKKTETKPLKGTKSTTKTKKKTTTKTKTKKPVPVYADYKESTLAPVKKVQDKLRGYAKKDKLKGLATNAKRLENFVDQVEDMGAKYKGAKSLQFNLIFLQLKKYANQKADKALSKWAKGLLAAFEVIETRDIAEEKRQKVKKAIKDKNPITEAFGRAEYSDARGDYHRAAKKLPPEMRKLFEPMPKDPAK